MTAVKNWARFQHFKDRSPPWIKLYRDLLDDIQWHKLDPAAAKALVMIWLIASENDGNLPGVEELAFRLRMPESAIEELLPKLSHWLEQPDITPISERYHDDTPGDISAIPLTRSRETEGETETETEEEVEREAAQAQPPPKPTPAKRAAKGSRFCPDDFRPDAEMLDWARAEFPKVDVAKQTAAFMDHEFAKPRSDWPRAWRAWIRRSDEWGHTPPVRAGPAPDRPGRYAGTIAALTGRNRQPEPETIDVIATDRTATTRLG